MCTVYTLCKTNRILLCFNTVSSSPLALSKRAMVVKSLITDVVAVPHTISPLHVVYSINVSAKDLFQDLNPFR